MPTTVEQDAGPNDEERGQPHVSLRASLARSSSSDHLYWSLGDSCDGGLAGGQPAAAGHVFRRLQCELNLSEKRMADG